MEFCWRINFAVNNLIQTGFLNRTPRGRMVTRLAYQHFGLDDLLKPIVTTPSLFD
ncbi:MAG: hypothetical protein AAB336_00745 [Acidobacteriota bacterium]